MTKQTCEHCRFFRNSECHKNPPASVVLQDAVTVYWPNVKKDDWCGEFQEAADYYP